MFKFKIDADQWKTFLGKIPQSAEEFKKQVSSLENVPRLPFS